MDNISLYRDLLTCQRNFLWSVYDVLFILVTSDLGSVHTAPFSNLSVSKDIQHPFKLIRFWRKTGRKMSNFVVHDRSHCSAFVKFHNGADAFAFFNFNVEFGERWVMYFVVAVVAFLFISVFVRSHWSIVHSKTSIFVNTHFEERFWKPSFLCGVVWTVSQKRIFCSPFLYKNWAV